MHAPLRPVRHHAVDIRLAYATPDNFTGQVIYEDVPAMLHHHAADALDRAAERAWAQGWRIGLLDAYRPGAAQERLWSIRPDPMYVADPAIGSDHTRGIAVDVTLIDAGGMVLDMGSDFDEASERSHHGYAGLDPVALHNRTTLLTLMEEAGFCRHPYEWWHYALPAAQSYPLLHTIGAY
ncbi:D-alanyl-D-alanine dipeptidase [Novosphingobium nitrogenifigens DSM 19370]|uniref:D-alanyl-D-alanine dipeptidase n=1 Tax=Novosphingobium nitrogenifigens DSM 19370 TaxID=983920 RepID=F1Z3X4_9SPHN|nr:D-alanyl-D-alanine dipeptidase [Novosphingobium nitrogenifigens]EGD60702.1 D-alanyl-D-alanine dipeptidase [Novosphingobium nitrogenifigens DSM 19370]